MARCGPVARVRELVAGHPTLSVIAQSLLSARGALTQRVAARAGMRQAKVALARKLAVVLHRMLADGTTFHAEKAAAARAG
jgi:hypothetical protein